MPDSPVILTGNSPLKAVCGICHKVIAPTIILGQTDQQRVDGLTMHMLEHLNREHRDEVGVQQRLFAMFAAFVAMCFFKFSDTQLLATRESIRSELHQFTAPPAAPSEQQPAKPTGPQAELAQLGAFLTEHFADEYRLGTEQRYSAAEIAMRLLAEQEAELETVDQELAEPEAPTDADIGQLAEALWSRMAEAAEGCGVVLAVDPAPYIAALREGLHEAASTPAEAVAS